ncbi:MULTISPECIES: hypothetical protein [unclassified Kitasatospora]|uniref:hypothetical protein n=1 Tax=unclassified Kitasatospora TaxID=2633591 RepID=UPI00382E381B
MGANSVYYARPAVRREAQGKSLEYLVEKAEHARWWERKAGRVEDSASVATEETEEWARIVDLIRARHLTAYDVDQDEQAQLWLTEHQERRAAQGEEQQRARRARQMRLGRRHLRVGLSAEAEQRLLELAAGLGVGMEQVLAEHVESAGEGLVQVPAVAVDAEKYPR